MRCWRTSVERCVRITSGYCREIEWQSICLPTTSLVEESPTGTNRRRHEEASRKDVTDKRKRPGFPGLSTSLRDVFARRFCATLSLDAVIPLEEQHEPGGHVRLLGPVRQAREDRTGGVTGRAFLSALHHELQGLRPLVVDTDGVRIVVRHHVLVAVAIGRVLEAAEAPAKADVRLRTDLVHDLSVAAV